MASEAATTQTEGAVVALYKTNGVTVYTGGYFEVSRMLYALELCSHRLLTRAMGEASSSD
jgi:hypothetical protein